MRKRIDGNLRDNSERLDHVRRDVFRICGALEASNVEYVVLKGLTQWPGFVPDPRLRAQYDLDLFCPVESIEPAREALIDLGYSPVAGFEDFPIDHLPTMVRKTGFEWRGNYYDPNIPVAVDIHFRLWDEATEGFRAPGVEEFWRRRTCRVIDGRRVPVLHAADALGYACLHVLRHVLRGSLRLCHAYEVAFFLERHATGEGFWDEWRSLHPPGLRRLEAIVFLLVQRWFGCRLADPARREAGALPEDVRGWFEDFPASPVEGLFRPNKDEVWLHVCLLDGSSAKWKVVRRRLLPVRLPARGSPGNVPPAEITPRMRRFEALRYGLLVVSRTAHHTVALAPALAAGVRWWLRSQGPGAAFWRYLVTASVFHLGVFIFILLYNLYLLDAGFGEDFLGLVAGAATAGSLAGSIPAAWALPKLGLKRTVVLTALSMGAVSAARSLVSQEAALLATAFAGGALTSLWFVSIAPTVSALTSERNRPLGFSLFLSAGIVVGVLGGLIGGRLPAWIAQVWRPGSPAAAKQAALLAGCAITAAAALFTRRLALPAAPPAESRTWPWSPFLRRFLGALAVWSFAVGAFNPFFTAYFARHLHVPDARIGAVFAGLQLAQAAAVLLAPPVLRRFGLIGGIASMQLAAALALACLAGGPPAMGAAALYASYMSFQSMCEPGAYTLLMNGVSAGQRGGATALNFLVVFGTQAIAAAAAGKAISLVGYQPTIAVASAMAALAALLFRTWVRKLAPDGT